MRTVETVLDRSLRPWRAASLSERRREPAIDDAGRALERLARVALAQAPQVIASCSMASHGPVERRGYAEIPEIADRAWRFTYAERVVFCVLDELSERSLLGWIVGGATARRPSAIERNIVAEAARRLLTCSDDRVPREFCEEPRARPQAQVWRCNLELFAHGKQPATFQLFTPCVPPQPPTRDCRPDLRGVALQIRAIFPSIGCALSDMSAWRAGTLLRLRRPEGDVSVALYAGGRRVAGAQLGALFGERAVRLVDVHAGSRS